MTTDPRDEVAELRSRICVKLAEGRPISHIDASDMLDAIEDLRQRLEAAERTTRLQQEMLADCDRMRKVAKHESHSYETALAEARAGQAAAWMAGRDAALEEAATLVDANMLCGDSDRTEVLMPRTNPGNTLGTAYSAAIRALKKGGTA